MSDRYGSGRNLLFAAIDSLGVNGDIQLIAAPASPLQIKIVSIVLTSNNTQDIVLKSGSTALTGIIPLMNSGSNNIVIQGLPTAHVFECAVAEAFVMNLSNTNSVGGHVSYYLERPVVYT